MFFRLAKPVCLLFDVCITKLCDKWYVFGVKACF